MQIGYFAYNASNGISMVKKDKTLWNASYENFLWLINEIENIDYEDLFLWGIPTPIPIDLYYSMFPKVLQEVNQISKRLMFTSQEVESKTLLLVSKTH